jgi:hypothetical protein
MLRRRVIEADPVGTVLRHQMQGSVPGHGAHRPRQFLDDRRFRVVADCFVFHIIQFIIQFGGLDWSAVSYLRD